MLGTQFVVDCNATRPGQCVWVVGSPEALGSWQPSRGLQCTTSAATFPQWTSPAVELPQGFEFKLVIAEEGSGAFPTWEYTSNKMVELPSTECTVECRWNTQDLDIQMSPQDVKAIDGTRTLRCECGDPDGAVGAIKISPGERTRRELELQGKWSDMQASSEEAALTDCRSSVLCGLADGRQARRWLENFMQLQLIGGVRQVALGDISICFHESNGHKPDVLEKAALQGELCKPSSYRVVLRCAVQCGALQLLKLEMIEAIDGTRTLRCECGDPDGAVGAIKISLGERTRRELELQGKWSDMQASSEEAALTDCRSSVLCGLADGRQARRWLENSLQLQRINSIRQVALGDISICFHESNGHKPDVLEKAALQVQLGKTLLESLCSQHGKVEPAQKAAIQDSGDCCTSHRPGSGRDLLKSLQKVATLGVGSFSAVELWEAPPAHSFAVKRISKHCVVTEKLQEAVMKEKNILFGCSSPFIVRLYETYNSKNSLYFLMEPALGGDLHSIYEKKGFYGSEKHAQFYVAGVVCALEHMHARQIIHRDIKPENLLLNEKGHLKVADMGLATDVSDCGTASTVCGSPMYMAPEVRRGAKYNHSADWWTVGVLVRELMVGELLFGDRLLKGVDADQPWGDIVKGLCRKKPDDRLHGPSVRNHAWYQSFDFEKYEDLALEVPFEPGRANFTGRCAHPNVPYTDDGSGWDKDFATIQ